MRGWKMKPLCLPQRLEGSKKSICFPPEESPVIFRDSFSTGGVSGVLPGLRRRIIIGGVRKSTRLRREWKRSPKEHETLAGVENETIMPASKTRRLKEEHFFFHRRSLRRSSGTPPEVEKLYY